MKYLFIFLLLILSCNKHQKKSLDDKNKDIGDVVSKFGWDPKEIHIHKTIQSDCELRLNPNSHDELMLIPKGTEVEILAEQIVKEGTIEKTWCKVSYKNKIGWISKHHFNK